MSNSNMTKQQAAEVLRYYNKWRRGGEGEQPDPKTIGIALETAIKCMSAPTPTDEQIGEVFEEYYDITPQILNEKYQFPVITPAMTRTAAIPFVREVIKLYFGNK